MRTFASLIAIFIVCMGCIAQNNLPNADDLDRIILTPVVLSNAPIPMYASSVAKNKLAQVATNNGIAGKEGSSRFVITINCIEQTRDITTSSPTMVAITISPTLFIGDIQTGIMYASYTLPPIKGVGSTDAKAYTTALKTINTNSPEIKNFVEKGKQKIIEYYNSQIDFIIANAVSMESNDNYDEAIGLLFTVPEVCRDAYIKSRSKIAEIYQKRIDVEGERLYNQAKFIWESTLSYDGAIEVADYLSKIHPLSKAAEQAIILSFNISRRIQELDYREWNFVIEKTKFERELSIKELENENAKQMALIDAAKAVGVAYASRPVTINYNQITWW